MTDLEVYRPAELAAHSDIDSWTQVAGQVIKLANEIYDTPFVPDGLRGSVPATAAAILAGRELGLGPMTSLANVHVIKGKPALSAALMRALILAQGHQIETIEVNNTRVVVRGRRRGEATWEEATFSADDAKRANIQLGGYPQDKLYARATSRLARRKFADVIAGMPYSAEELEDGTPGDVMLPDDPGYKADREAAKAKPRTAQRRQPAAAAQPASPPAPAAAAPQRAAEAPLPPLPGEDEPPAAEERDYDSPGTVTPAQLRKLGATFSGLGFTSGEREQRLVAASEIIGRELATSADLSRTEASTLIDTLTRCGTRDRLITLLATGEIPAEGTDGS